MTDFGWLLPKDDLPVRSLETQIRPTKRKMLLQPQNLKRPWLIKPLPNILFPIECVFLKITV